MNKERSGTVHDFAKKLIQQFPEYQKTYRHLLWEYDGKIPGHIFFGEINPILAKLLKENSNKEMIRKYIDFIEDMFHTGDADAKNIVVVTILEYLGDDEMVLRNAFIYFSEELMRQSQDIEGFWGRRNIQISHRNGMVAYGWKWPLPQDEDRDTAYKAHQHQTAKYKQLK